MMDDDGKISKLSFGKEIYQVTSYRWVILLSFCFLEFSNATTWVTFAPISDVSAHYFGGGDSYGSTTNINMLANIFLVLYLPGTILASMLLKYYGPRWSLLFAGSLTTIGTIIRYIAALSNKSLGDGNTYILMFLGQSCSALAQPMFLNSPSSVASTWFAVNERDISTTIGSMFSPIGNAVGQLLPVAFVSESSEVSPGKHLLLQY